MCECCSNHAAGHQGHIHVVSINCDDCYRGLEDVLKDVPGIISLEFIRDAEQAKVVFDKRILEITSLERLLDNNGYAVS